MVVHRLISFFWKLPQVLSFLHRSTLFCSRILSEASRGEAGHVTWVLHNDAGLHETFNVAFENSHKLLSPEFVTAYAQRVRTFASLWNKAGPPTEVADLSVWCRQQLRGATRGLSEVALADQLAADVATMVATMKPGNERAHLLSLLRFVDLRGTDVHLCSGQLLGGSTQRQPYPAFGWDWRRYQAYPWRAPGHINVLELTAVYNYVVEFSKSLDSHDCRSFIVLDSRVAAAVLAKGRSSSRALLRILRRMLPFILASNVVLLPLWTLPCWNFADGASRQFECHDE